ncbi:hypothetical protein QN277_015232 [Acacia crassicarpa]|uniref:Uncharacterized protein n=1 Tax=Acacia crassicarpa TaxID=499986 RepID=A0AAE1JVD4_9FABA|nr:hypothetical protein QN277_015232 [Acacia crassicarpa]
MAVGSSLAISQADFSSDGTEIYASFVDGTIKILDASNLEPLCRVDPTAYIPLPPLQVSVCIWW